MGRSKTELEVSSTVWMTKLGLAEGISTSCGESADTTDGLIPSITLWFYDNWSQHVKVIANLEPLARVSLGHNSKRS